MFQVDELLDYWHDSPPLHLMFAAFVGHEPKGKARDVKRLETDDDMRAFAEMVNGAMRR